MTRLLRSIWEEPSAPGARGPVWRDWAFAGALVVIALTEWILRPGMALRPVQLALTLALIPTTLWRRSRPLLMVAIAFTGCYAVQAATHGAVPQMLTLVFLEILPYSLYRWGSGRDVVIGSSIVLVNTAISFLLGNTGVVQGLEGSGFLFAAGAAGVAFRFRAVTRARELDHVKLLERERLARDLHDTVAHHVSAIAIRAQAGLAQPSASQDALHLIETEATRALAEMRTIVKVLRQDEPATPRVVDLQQLARSTGTPPVDVEITGDVEDLPPAVGSAIYRVAQESVTNARRHARHATRIKVRIAVDDTSVQLRVSDDGEAGPARAKDSPGFGLTGMIERAGLLGGTFEAGPNPDKGWTVTAVLPRTGSPA